MQFAGMFFVLSIIALSLCAWLGYNWILANRGDTLDDEGHGQLETTARRENSALREENRQLKDQLGVVNERIAVIERIVTDRGYGLADEIEALRDASDAGVPLDVKKGERA